MTEFLTALRLEALNHQILNGSADAVEAARTELWMAYDSYIVSQAKQLSARFGIPKSHVADVIAECQIVAFDAVQKFDPRISPSYVATLKFKFAPAVMAYMGRTLWSITVPPETVRSARRVIAATMRLRSLGNPTARQIAIESRETVEFAEHFSRAENVPSTPTSIDAPLPSKHDESDLTLADVLPSDEPSVITRVFSDDVKRLLNDSLLVLNPRERRVIDARVSAVDDDMATLETLGQEFGVSKEYVRQIEEKALEKLRAYMRRKHLTYEKLSMVE